MKILLDEQVPWLIVLDDLADNEEQVLLNVDELTQLLQWATDGSLQALIDRAKKERQSFCKQQIAHFQRELGDPR